MNSEPYVIVGNSVAAMACVEGIRDTDKTTPITLIAKEPHHTYSRPLITYLLGGLVTEEQMMYRPLDYYEKTGVRTILDAEVTRVDTTERFVETADDRRIGFEKLLIAVGGRPIVPTDVGGTDLDLLIAVGGRPIVPTDVGGTDLDGVFTFTTLDDAHAIQAYIAEHEVTDELVVGGGLIGLKSVEALLELDLNLTVVELADRMLSSTFDETASDLLQKKLREAGVRVLCNNTVSRIRGRGEGGKVSGAILRDGSEFNCGMVIFAIGVLPDTRMVEGTDVEVDRGILVDDHMQTSVEGIYAAGDVSQARELLGGEQRCIPIFPNAYRQGMVAGGNMSGAGAEWDGGLVMNAVAICGMNTISVGMTSALDDTCEVFTTLDEADYHYKKIVLRGDHIVGAIFVNDIDRAGIITGLIRGRVNVASFKDELMAEDFGLISLPTEYRKHVVSGQGIEV
jgi:NAD(P)H-nitrite reductase large subunit